MSDIFVSPATLYRRAVKLGENIAIWKISQKSDLDRNIRCILRRSWFAYKIDQFLENLATSGNFWYKYQNRELIEIFAAISNGRGFLMFLTTSQDFWQELNISSRNRKNKNWSKYSLQSQMVGVSLCFDHFPRLLAGTEHFEQKSQKRELIEIFAAISKGRGFLMF